MAPLFAEDMGGIAAKICDGRHDVAKNFKQDDFSCECRAISGYREMGRPRSVNVGLTTFPLVCVDSYGNQVKDGTGFDDFKISR